MTLKTVLIGQQLLTLAFLIGGLVTRVVVGGMLVSTCGLVGLTLVSIYLVVCHKGALEQKVAQTQARILKAEEDVREAETRLGQRRGALRTLALALNAAEEQEEELRRRIQNSKRRTDYHRKRNPAQVAPEAADTPTTGALDHILEDDD